MFLISGLCSTTGVYISIFKVDLAGNKRPMELGYVMDIITFNLLFKLMNIKDLLSATYIALSKLSKYMLLKAIQRL